MIRFGHWGSKRAHFFTYTRIYWRGRWTPFCKMRVRWVNVVSDLIRLLEWDWRQAMLTRLYTKLNSYQQPPEPPDRYGRSGGRYDRGARP